MYKIAFMMLLFFVDSYCLPSYYDKYLDRLMKAENEDLLAEMSGEIAPGVKEDRQIMRHIKILKDSINDFKKSIAVGLYALRVSGVASVKLGREQVIMNDFIADSHDLLKDFAAASSKIVEEVSLLEAKTVLERNESFYILDMAELMVEIESEIRNLAETVRSILKLINKDLGKEL